MKPFYTDKMLIECSTREMQILRIAVANEMTRWSKKDTGVDLYYKEQYEKYEKLYKEMTVILESMPWSMV